MKISNQKIKSLFKGANNDWQNNACLNFSKNSLLGYSWGYKEAAEFLVLNASNLGMQDLFVYPIAFLYRHHLELHLKLIIDKGRLLLSESAALPEYHDLDKLWVIARNIIHRIWPNGDITEFDIIDHVINEYVKIDNKSMAFRYTMDKKGNKHLANITHINLTDLIDIIGKASEFLDGVYSGILDHYDAKCEALIERGFY